MGRIAHRDVFCREGVVVIHGNEGIVILIDRGSKRSGPVVGDLDLLGRRLPGIGSWGQGPGLSPLGRLGLEKTRGGRGDIGVNLVQEAG